MVGESKWVFKKSKLNKPKINVAQILPRGPIEGRLCLVAPTGVRDSTLKKKAKKKRKWELFTLFNYYILKYDKSKILELLTRQAHEKYMDTEKIV